MGWFSYPVGLTVRTPEGVKPSGWAGADPLAPGRSTVWRGWEGARRGAQKHPLSTRHFRASFMGSSPASDSMPPVGEV